MTLDERQKQIKTLMQYPEFKAFEDALWERLQEIRDVTSIDPAGDVAAQTLGRQAAYKEWLSFFEDLDILKEAREINPYEDANKWR